MDYHFIIPKKDIDTPRGSKILSFIKKLLPVFLLAAILPAFIFFITTPPDLRFSPQANEEHELRLWLEPKNVVSSQGKDIELKVMAQFESDSLIIPSMKISITSDGLTVGRDIIDYQRPFKGQVELGTVTVRTNLSGSFSVEIPSESVIITAFDKPLKIITSSAQVIVK